jgi:phage terminase large subunit-like protein
MRWDEFAGRLADRMEEPTRQRTWRQKGRPAQFPPDVPWNIWLIMAGRGFGKTFTGAGWITEQAATHPGSAWGVFAPTYSDVRRICVEGESGILKAAIPGEIGDGGYNRTLGEIRFYNGSVIYMISADQPERARGHNLWGAWCDELGSWRREETWYEGLVPAVRLGASQIVVTTTPRPTKLVRDLFSRKDGSVKITRGSTFDNADNLSAVALQELRRRYEGTRLGRQELEGQLLDDIEGALWQRDLIQYWPADSAAPAFERVVVAIDPAVTAGEDSDETGIIAAGRLPDDAGYIILRDKSDRLVSAEWGKRAVSTFKFLHGDRMVAEVNNGGDLVESLIRSIDPEIPYRAVRASRGKITRAEPIASLYEQKKVWHAEVFTDLEDQMCTYTPGDKSPDRVDALVWALTELSEVERKTVMTWAGPARPKPDYEVPHAVNEEQKVIEHALFGLPEPGGWN